MRRTLLLALVVPLVAIAAVFLTLRLHAQATPSRLGAQQFATFGMVGLAANQTARLNALGLPIGGPIIAGASCDVTLEFLNEQGAALKSTTQKVIDGQSVHLDLQRGDIDAGPDRKEIRGTVLTSFTSPTASATPLFGVCSVFPTLEVFDQETGRTMTMVESTRALPLVLPLTIGQ